MKSKIKIKVHSNWSDPKQRNVRNFLNYLCTKMCDYTWKNIYLTDKDDYDYFVIFNYPLTDEYDPAKTIVFRAEPDITVDHVNMTSDRWNYEFTEGMEDKFFYIFDMDRHFAVDGAWKIWMPYSRLLRTNFKKTKYISALVSDARHTPMHIDRLEFCEYYLSTLDGFDHFGRGNGFKSPSYRGEMDFYSDAYTYYKYTFNCERAKQRNYFTEKIRDPVLCEALCFYDGCPNIEDFIDPRCFVKVDVSDPDKSLNIVKEALKNNEWERRIDFIRKEKIRIMEDLNPLNIIWSIVNEHPVRTFKDIILEKERELIQ